MGPELGGAAGAAGGWAGGWAAGRLGGWAAGRLGGWGWRLGLGWAGLGLELAVGLGWARSSGFETEIGLSENGEVVSWAWSWAVGLVAI